MIGGERIYHADTLIPWVNHLIEDNRRIFPRRWWPYGVAANSVTVDTSLRYRGEQGLSTRRLTCEGVFVADLLET